MKISLTKCLPYRPSSMDSKAVEVPLAEGSGNKQEGTLDPRFVILDESLASTKTKAQRTLRECKLCIFLVQWNMIEEEKIGMKEKEERINREKKKKMKNDVC